MKSSVCYALLLVFVISGCVTSGDLATTRNFSIGQDTTLSITPSNDPKSMVLVLENELLRAGFDVAPYELASRQVKYRAETKVASEQGRAAAQTEASLSSGLYLPSAVAVTMTYNYSEYPAATYFTKAFIRLIDLENQKLLLSYSVDGSEWTPLSMNKVIKDFVMKLKTYRH